MSNSPLRIFTVFYTFNSIIRWRYNIVPVTLNKLTEDLYVEISCKEYVTFHISLDGSTYL